jgi:glycosyltransferase 2 family protein
MWKKIYYLIVAVFFFIFLYKVSQNKQDLLDLKWNLYSLDFIFFLAFLFSIYIVNIVSWHILMIALGAKIKFVDNLRIWMVSNLNRVLPGGIWQYPTKIYLLNKIGISKTTATTATLLEVLANLAFGFIAIIISLRFWEIPDAFRSFTWVLYLIGIVSIAMFFLNSKLLNILVSILRKLTKQTEKLSLVALPVKWFIPLSLSFLARFLITGGTLYFLIRLFIPLDGSMFIVIVGLFSLAWLLGYVSFFAPGGIGVQEVILATLLSVYIPWQLAGVLVIAFRVSLILGEVVFLIPAFAFGKKLLSANSS